MQTNSYLELFTTLFGWQLYGAVWDILAASGLIYVPLVVIIVREWQDAARGGEYAMVHEVGLKRLEIALYTAIIVAIIAGPPTMTLTASQLSYQPPATSMNPAPALATPAAPGQEFGRSGFQGAPSSVEIPVWWYLVQSLSKAVTNAVRVSLPDSVTIRDIRGQAELASIPHPALKAEVKRFYDECYVPARAEYVRENNRGRQQRAQRLLTQWGEADTAWMGSHVLREIYYTDPPNSPQSSVPMTGFRYDATRDASMTPAERTAANGNGRPTCGQWWQDPSAGLQQRIIDSSPENRTFWQGLTRKASQLTGWFGGVTPRNVNERVRDMATQAVLRSVRQTFELIDAADDGSSSGGVLGIIKSLGVGAGAAPAAAISRLVVHALTIGRPIFQAALLMIGYMILPFVIVVSCYSLRMMFTVALGLFSIHFWRALWDTALWIDANLMAAIYGGNSIRIIETVMSGNIQGIASHVVVEFILALLLMAMPVIWTTFMAWSGAQIGGGLQGLVGTAAGGIGSAAKGPVKMVPGVGKLAS